MVNNGFSEPLWWREENTSSSYNVATDLVAQAYLVIDELINVLFLGGSNSRIQKPGIVTRDLVQIHYVFNFNHDPQRYLNTSSEPRYYFPHKGMRHICFSQRDIPWPFIMTSGDTQFYAAHHSIFHDFPLEKTMMTLWQGPIYHIITHF